jgi:hypothetical protein
LIVSAASTAFEIEIGWITIPPPPEKASAG